jgi:hypothetical protein
MATDNEDFNEYVQAFVQRVPRYGIKTRKQGWSTRNKPLADPAIKAHLAKKYTIGGLSPWYPQFAILDIDRKPIEFVDEVRGELDLDETNSMLIRTESADSYHCLLRPTLAEKPPTRHQLTKAFKTFAYKKGIEIYPQVNRVIRLPFGKFSQCLDFDYAGLQTWQEKLFWFNKLDDFGLSEVSGQQYELPFAIKPLDKALPALVGPGGDGWYGQGAELLKKGLQGPSTRHESQAKVIYYLWRQNVPYEEAIWLTWAWIQHQHNGYSQDILKFSGAVKKEIERQVSHTYLNYQWAGKYPDSTHKSHNGYICKPDIEEILKVTGASMPRAKFLFHLVKHSYPRRYRTFVPVRRDLLTTWGNERTYQRYLHELEGKGLVKRGRAYSVGKFSKSLKLSWDFKSSDQAVLFEGRATDTWKGTVKLLFDPGEFRAMLRGAGAKRTTTLEAIRGIYG